jgi:hypothetical protein
MRGDDMRIETAHRVIESIRELVSQLTIAFLPPLLKPVVVKAVPRERTRFSPV